MLVNLQTDRPELRDALPALKRLLAAARASKTAVFHVRSRALAQTTSPALLRRGADPSADSPFLSGFEPQGRELAIDKFRASALVDCRLGQLLRTHLIEDVVLAGTSALDDIDMTARDALDRDWRVTIAADALGFTPDERPIEAGWRQLTARRGCEFRTVDDLGRAWAG